MREFTLEIRQKAGTVFNVTATLNGYQVIPSDENNPNAWHGQIPDKQIPLVVASVGVALSYEIHYCANGAADTNVPRRSGDNGVDIFHADV